MSLVPRVCLITPGHLSTNPRLVKEAVALSAHGVHVEVVHGRFKAWGTANDRDIAKNLCNRTFAVPSGPVEASRGVYLRQTVGRRIALGLARAGFVSDTIVSWAHGPVVPDLVRFTARRRAELYVAHYVGALPAAANAARLHGGQYAFDAEDFHLGDLPEKPEHQLEKDIIRLIESRFLPGAAYVTAASPMIAEAYAETYGITLPTTILNVFPSRSAPARPTARGTVEPGPSLYWFSQTIGPGRGLENAIDAIARAASRPHLYLRGSPAGGYEARLRTLAHQAGVADKLHFLPPAAPEELERLGACFDLGLVSELTETKNRQIALTNKLFSYLISGVPSIASDIPAHRAIAAQLGTSMRLFRSGDAASLSAAIDNLLLNPARLADARDAAWRLGQEKFNFEAEAGKLVSLVKAALA